MKKLLILAAFIFFSQSAFSQFKFGVVASYGAAVGNSESQILGNEIGRKSMEFGFVEHSSTPSLGLSLAADFGPLFATGEIHYRKNAYKISVQNFLQIDAPNSFIDETSSVIHVPITGGVKVGKIRLGVGPIFNFQTNQSKDQISVFNIEERKRSLQMGFLGSVGVDVTDHIRVGLKYEHSFSRIGDDYKYGGKQLKIQSRLNYFTASVGYFF